MAKRRRIVVALAAVASLVVTTGAAQAGLVVTGGRDSVIRVTVGGTIVPSVLYVQDTVQKAPNGTYPKPPGGTIIFDGDYYGVVPTYVSPTGTCAQSPTGPNTICPHASRVELRYGAANDFLIASWYDAFFDANYSLSVPLYAWGGGGADSLDGSKGDDRLYGQSGGDDLYGFEGNDLLDAGSAAANRSNSLDGGSGNDTLYSQNGVGDDVTCGSGKDTAYVDQWDDVRGCERIVRKSVAHLGLTITNDDVSGTPGNDRLTGTKKASRLSGAAGNDRIDGRGGADHLIGGSGRDKLIGGTGRDVITGDAGRDTVDGGSGNDTIYVRKGSKDTVSCGSGRDTVYASRNDVLKGCEKVRYRAGP